MRRMMRITAVLPLILILACGSASDEASNASGQKASGNDAISAFEMEHGIGPIKEVKLSAINETMAATGLEHFTAKCSACHKLDERYVGPAMRDITTRRTPEFIMNMILNPDEMVKRHPVVKELLATYLTPMTFQNVTEADARAILEYFRLVAQETPGS